MENHFNCIYCYINKVNGKRYIGQTKDFNRRHKQHLHNNEQLIDKKIKEYGKENFYVEILEENLNSDELDIREIYYINLFDTLVDNGKGYNVAIRGKGSCPKKMPVIQININGELIKKYDSIIEATDELGNNTGNIIRSCRTGQATKGYIFIYDSIEKILNLYYESDLSLLNYELINYGLENMILLYGIHKTKEIIERSFKDIEFFKNIPLWLLSEEEWLNLYVFFNCVEEEINKIKDKFIVLYMLYTNEINLQKLL